MADDAVIWSTVSALVGGAIGGIAGWLTKRAEKAPDIQATLAAGIADVVAHYNGALDRSDREAAALRGDVAELRRLVEEQSAKLDEQAQEISDLIVHIGRLERSIFDLGGKPPARRRATKSIDGGAA